MAFDRIFYQVDKNGSRVWARSLGSSEDDACCGLAVWKEDVYLFGRTDGVMKEGLEERDNRQLGTSDLVLARVSVDAGELVWLHQELRLETQEVGWDLSVHKTTIHLVGRTNGDLFRDGKPFAEGPQKIFYGQLRTNGKDTSITGVLIAAGKLDVAHTVRIVRTADDQHVYILISGTKQGQDGTSTFCVIKLATTSPFKEVLHPTTSQTHTTALQEQQKNIGIHRITGM